MGKTPRITQNQQHTTNSQPLFPPQKQFLMGEKVAADCQEQKPLDEPSFLQLQPQP